MSDRALVVAREENLRMSGRLKKWREQNAEVTQKAIGAVVGGAAAYGIGWVKGRYPDSSEVLGQPIAAIASAGGLVLSMTGALGKESYIAHAVGLTTGGKYLGDMGEEAGKTAKDEAGD